MALQPQSANTLPIPVWPQGRLLRQTGTHQRGSAEEPTSTKCSTSFHTPVAIWFQLQFHMATTIFKLLTKSTYHTEAEPGKWSPVAKWLKRMFSYHIAPLPSPLALEMPSDHGLQETNSPPLLKVAFALPVPSPCRLNLNGSVVLLQRHPNAAGTPASLREEISTIREGYFMVGSVVWGSLVF